LLFPANLHNFPQISGASLESQAGAREAGVPFIFTHTPTQGVGGLFCDFTKNASQSDGR
jgi:hypothetical protein